jgi:hypothetical protein
MIMFEIDFRDTHYGTVKIKAESYAEAMELAFAYDGELEDFERVFEVSDSYKIEGEVE